MTDEQIEALLRDPACPWAQVLRGGGERSIRVEDFIRFDRSAGLPTTRLEQQMDRFVPAIGGRRERVLDPWSALPNLIRRLTGRLTSPPLDLWVVPQSYLKNLGPHRDR